MNGLRRRLDLAERRLPRLSPARVVDLTGVYGRLAAAGLAFWDRDKSYWSPVDPRGLRAALAERRQNRGR